LVDNVFKDNPQAIWYNNDNLAEHRNFGEAFDLRTFSAHLIKYENWDDYAIADMYGGEGKGAIVAAQQIEYELVDFEQDLWEN
jgi:Gliding motility associated protein GldN